MKLQIHYQAEYRYEEPVSLSPHIVRIFPRADHLLRPGVAEFSTAPTASVSYRRDLFDNNTASLFFPGMHASMPLGFRTVVETPERNPFAFLLEARALRIPIAYTAEERAVLAAFLQPSGQPTDWCNAEPWRVREPRPTMETLVTQLTCLHQTVAYERRDEGAAFAPAETFARGSGSCRDFAALLIELLRLNGVAARWVSGFLWEGDLTEQPHVAEGAMHAWVEAYLPGAGWVGLDPTNGVLADHHAIPTAVGLTAADVAPVTGTYFGQKTIPSRLETCLKVERIE
jgi:transglutaminase-like putative cysteine protease